LRSRSKKKVYANSIIHVVVSARCISLARERDALDTLAQVAETVWLSARSKLREASESRSLYSKFDAFAYDQFDAQAAQGESALKAPVSTSFMFVNVVSGHVWSLTTGIKFALPSQVAGAMEFYSQFFKSASQLKKVLTWVPTQGAVSLAMKFGASKVSLLTAPLTASLLLLFNDHTSLTAEAAAKLLQITVNELTPSLLSLTTAPHDVLLNNNSGSSPTDVKASDVFALNPKFAPRTAVVAVHEVLVTDVEREQITEGLQQWRRALMEAALVRLVKAAPDGVPYESAISVVKSQCSPHFSPQRADIVKRIRALVHRKYIVEVGAEFAKTTADDSEEALEHSLRHVLKYAVAAGDTAAALVVADRRDPLWPRLLSGLSLSSNAITLAQFKKQLVQFALNSAFDSKSNCADIFMEAQRCLRFLVRAQLASLMGEVVSSRTEHPNVREGLVSRNRLVALGGLLPASLRRRFGSGTTEQLKGFVRWAGEQITSGSPVVSLRGLCARIINLLETERFAELVERLDSGQGGQGSWGMFGIPQPAKPAKAKTASAFDDDTDNDGSASSVAFGQPTPTTFGIGPRPQHFGLGPAPIPTLFGTGPPRPSTFGFGSTSPRAPAPAFGASLTPSFGGFGSTSTTRPSFGGFVTSAAPSGGLGTTIATPVFGGFGTASATPAFGTASATPAFGGFGTASATPAFGGFGTASATPAFGGFGTASATPAFGGFGTASATPAFGGFGTATATPTFGGFGTAAAPPSSGFGTATSAAPAFGSATPRPTGRVGFNLPAASSTGYAPTSPEPVSAVPVEFGLSQEALNALQSSSAESQPVAPTDQPIHSDGDNAPKQPSDTDQPVAEEADEDFSSMDDKIEKWVLGHVESAMIAAVFAKLSDEQVITAESVAAATAKKQATV
jgi:hypothetical protein